MAVMTAVSLGFFSEPLDGVDYMIKFHFFSQTTYRTYRKHIYKKVPTEGPTTVLGVQPS